MQNNCSVPFTPISNNRFAAKTVSEKQKEYQTKLEDWIEKQKKLEIEHEQLLSPKKKGYL